MEIWQWKNNVTGSQPGMCRQWELPHVDTGKSAPIAGLRKLSYRGTGDFISGIRIRNFSEK